MTENKVENIKEDLLQDLQSKITNIDTLIDENIVDGILFQTPEMATQFDLMEEREILQVKVKYIEIRRKLGI